MSTPNVTVVGLGYVGLPLLLAASWAWIGTVLGVAGVLARIRREEAIMAKEKEVRDLQKARFGPDAILKGRALR